MLVHITIWFMHILLQTKSWSCNIRLHWFMFHAHVITDKRTKSSFHLYDWMTYAHDMSYQGQKLQLSSTLLHVLWQFIPNKLWNPILAYITAWFIHMSLQIKVLYSSFLFHYCINYAHAIRNNSVKPQLPFILLHDWCTCHHRLGLKLEHSCILFFDLCTCQQR